VNRASTSLRDWLESLTGCRDVASLRSGITDLCAEFGKVTHIDVLTLAVEERRSAVCLLRLESDAQERQLMSSLGISRFGDDLLIIVDLPARPIRLAV
jgi:hypothetical protein